MRTKKYKIYFQIYKYRFEYYETEREIFKFFGFNPMFGKSFLRDPYFPRLQFDINNTKLELNIYQTQNLMEILVT